jgi:hypothetical protein
MCKDGRSLCIGQSSAAVECARCFADDHRLVARRFRRSAATGLLRRSTRCVGPSRRKNASIPAVQRCVVEWPLDGNPFERSSARNLLQPAHSGLLASRVPPVTGNPLDAEE